jgi:chromosome segregation ATPase
MSTDDVTTETTETATATASEWAGVRFEDFDAVVTSALDAIDGAAESFFTQSDDAEQQDAGNRNHDDSARVNDDDDDAASMMARSWRKVGLENVQRVISALKEVVDADAVREKEAKGKLREALKTSEDSKRAARVLTEEVRRLEGVKTEILERVRGLVENEALVSVGDPSEMLETAGIYRRELDVARVERDAAKKAMKSASSGADVESLRATMEEKMRVKIESALKMSEAKRRAAEQSADSAREGRANAETKLMDLQQRYDEAQSKLFELEDAAETAMEQVKAERDELAALSESLRAREDAADAADVRKRQARLAEALQDEKDETSLREKLAVKERMVVQLAASIEEAEAATKEKEKAHKAATADLQSEIVALTDELSKAKASLSQSSMDMDKLNTRIKMLQEVSGVAADGDDGEDENGAASVESVNGGTAPAIQSLRERVKKISAELAVAQRERDEAVTNADVAKGAQQAVERKYAEAAQMVTTLENDLANKLTRIIEEKHGGDGSAETSTDGNSDLLTILTAQRDRFKRRVGELDDRASRIEAEKVSAEDSRKKLEADNVQLYEKLQYVQNYYSKQVSAGGKTKILRVDEDGIPVTGDAPASASTQSQAAKNARYSCGVVTVNIESERTAAAVDGMRRRAARYGCFGPGGPGGDLPGGDAGGVVGRYRRKYLARLNPFNAFRASQNDESASTLPIHDRIGLQSGKMLLTNRTTRTLFSLYIIAIHFYLLTRVVFGGRATA